MTVFLLACRQPKTQFHAVFYIFYKATIPRLSVLNFHTCHKFVTSRFPYDRGYFYANVNIMFPFYTFNFMVNHGPVSYTHLDVYKRQLKS